MKSQIASVQFPVICTIMLLAFCFQGFAQKPVTWKGGTPGRETDWHCPKNWSTGAVPDAFSNVSIPDVSATTRSLPVIRAGKVEVNALLVHPNAGLTVGQNAELYVVEVMDDNGAPNMDVAGRLYGYDHEKKEMALAPPPKAVRRY